MKWLSAFIIPLFLLRGGNMMDLAELKIRLELSEDDVSDEKLQIDLDDAIDEVQRMCKQDFIVDGTLKLPPTVKKAVAKLVGYELSSTDGVKQETYGDTSFTYLSTEELKSSIYDDLSKAGFIKKNTLTFIPSCPRWE